MTTTSTATAAALAGALAVLCAALPAAAQIAQAPGVPLKGFCVYSEQNLLGQSQVGVVANQKLAQIQQSVTAEIKTTTDQLVAEARALDAKKATTPAAQYQQQVADIQRRAKDEDALTRVRNDQLGRTRDDAIARITKAAVPLFNASLAAHGCAIVLDKAPVYSVNPAMDLTPEVTQKLNAVMTTIDVQLAAPRTAK